MLHIIINKFDFKEKLSFEKNPRLRLYYCVTIVIYIWLRINFLLKVIRPFLKKEKFKEFALKHHTKNAHLLYRTILKLRGLFIKVGQFLSMRVDLLPSPYTKELSKLQDQVPPHDFREIEKRLRDELGKIEEIFLEFEKEPIASASLGQVHKAKLKNGQLVAVKVQYPGIEKIVETDLKVLQIILRFFGFFRKNLQWKILLEEFKEFVFLELDYINEGKNAERIKEDFRDTDWVVVPSVLWEFTTKRVLTLEYIDGIKVTDYPSYERMGIKREEVMERVLELYFRMIFSKGFFQADPHPGNIFVLQDGRIALLDFGLSREIKRETIQGFGRMARAVAERNPEELALAFKEIGFVSINGKTDGFRRFADIVVKYAPQVVYKNPRSLNLQEISSEILELVRKYPLVRIPSDFLLMGRVMGLLLGLGKFLKAKVNVNEIIMKALGG
jgi:predicted unusual protein kinase regulating ubiquinone biosynthesis (AarF/ABC1/UbiB family)